MRGERDEVRKRRIRDVLLVASRYDSFILEEDGQLPELALFDSLDAAPGLTAVSTGAEALELLPRESFGLVLSTMHVGDINAATLARRVQLMKTGVPVVLLAYDTRELTDFLARHGSLQELGFYDAFLWQGDVRLLAAIVKCVEDRQNVDHDTRLGVQVILLIEDDLRYTSSFLPAIYDELATHSRRLLPEGLNIAHKRRRLMARPKILLCRTWEEAWDAVTRYHEEILGIVSDVAFPRGGLRSSTAGVDFARAVREQAPDVPVVLQSSKPENEALAREAGASFLLKGSPTLLHDLRKFMAEYFGFGDFVFRLPNGKEVARAEDMKALEEKLKTVPAACVAYHGERNHFSKWLKARTEFLLARKLRPRKVTDFATHDDLRQNLIVAIAEYRLERNQALVSDFDRQAFDEPAGFYRIGGGSLGGKARGLAFVRTLLHESGLLSRFPGVRLGVPGAVVIGTSVFDQFLEENGLRDLAINSQDDEEVSRRFAAAFFPEQTCLDLAAYLGRVHYPLAVRSSSILEDSQYQPFTGVYDTLMLPNNEGGIEARLARLLAAIKTVYASTFTQRAKAYLRATPYRLEEEKMAVILQRVVGGRHGQRFYPTFSGVARSHNFYPSAPLSAEDGIVAVALGLGRAVVDGGNCVRFCPRYPRHLAPFSSVTDVLDNSQREFWALKLSDGEGMREVSFGLEVAEADGTLDPVGSTYSPENDAIYDGLSRTGVRLVSFAPILKHDLVPLAPLLADLMEVGARGMSAPVEIEFAVNLDARGRSPEFGVLQMRPLALSRESEELELPELPRQQLICGSTRVLGNGTLEVSDLVVVDFHRFERARSREAAQEVARLNGELMARRVPYVLIGVGRWGSRDPWLGIPVTWEQIAGARAIVEAGLKDFKVTPSQGSHFFQNLTSFNVGYFTVNDSESGVADGFVDWDWLSAQPARSEASHVRHLSLPRAVRVTMNGRLGEGVIVKPEAG